MIRGREEYQAKIRDHSAVNFGLACQKDSPAEAGSFFAKMGRFVIYWLLWTLR
jgi:hypothetical protein